MSRALPAGLPFGSSASAMAFKGWEPSCAPHDDREGWLFMSLFYRFIGPGSRRTSMGLIALKLGVFAGLAAPNASAGVPPYTLVGSYELPAGTSAFDVLADGRILAIASQSLFLQSALSTSSYALAGAVAPGTISPFGASFLRVSPDGSMIAIGDNNFGPGATVHTLVASSLNPATPSTTTAWNVPNAEAHWRDGSRLYVSGSGNSGSVVTEINLTNASTRTVISNIGGASGGVVTAGTRLFTSNGFDFAPDGSDAGEVRAFDLASIDALAAGASLNFEVQGTPVADALSGASLGFDPMGNLLIGGGDAFGSGDAGYAAIVDNDAVGLALSGGPLAPDSAELRLTPRLASDSYFTRFNHATNELLVTYFDNTTFQGGLTVYRYAIPAPAGVTLSTLMLCIAARRRRDTAC